MPAKRNCKSRSTCYFSSPNRLSYSSSEQTLQSITSINTLKLQSPLESRNTAMDLHPYTFTLPFFFCFLLSCGSSTPTPLSPPPSSSAHAAADALRNRGYSLFASTLDSSTTTTNNFSGTVLAPPDFIFSFATANIFPPRPSSVILLYHTLKIPLTWAHLSSTSNGAEIPTLYSNNCLFLFKSLAGEILISSRNTSIGAVKIRQPDIYVGDHITVHGIDGVLDATSATECSVPQVQTRTSVAQPQDHRYLLERAIRALRRRRFTVAATALTVKRLELLRLTSVSVFAPSDTALFSRPDGFRYDYRHHVVPQRYRFGDLARTAKGSVVVETLAPNKTLVVNFVDGVVTVNDVVVNRTEVYRNRWIVVLSVSMSLDDAVNLLDYGNFAPSLAPVTMEIRYPDEIVESSPAGVPSLSPATTEIPYPDEIIDGFNDGVQSPAPATMEIHYPVEINNGFTDEAQSPSPAIIDIPYPDERINASAAGFQSPAPPMAVNEVIDPGCVFGIPVGIEGGDLLCPASGPQKRKLEEIEDLNDGHVAAYPPSDVKDQLSEVVNQSVPLISSDESDRGSVDRDGEEENRMNIMDENHINMADDLFFYF
ncbi:hypothetical protein A4A49_21857 [Nicotiana attenuata]|uniref:FAS1 domain-containing protein n=1 Tax=Nicotiana attenuata TaxID=49451 RepID=A0A1J6LBR8_NICAT|nr:hypothetical protein A4A49_21857 [Nicotiana attenuata]